MAQQDHKQETDQAIEHYWRGLCSRLDQLDDWELNLALILLFRSGPQEPGQPTRPTGLGTFCERIGSLRGGGHHPAAKARIREAAQGLEAKGLMKPREQEDRAITDHGSQDGPGTPYRWMLRDGFDDPIEPDWSGAYEMTKRMCRRKKQLQGGARVRASAARLALAISPEGTFAATAREWAEILKVRSPETALKRLDEIEAAQIGLKKVTKAWDAGSLKISVEMQQFEQAQSIDQQRSEALEVRDKLWHPALVDQAIVRVNERSGHKMTAKRARVSFYEPVLDLQTKYPNAPLVKYALEETLKGPALDNPSPGRWWRYTETVCKNNQQKFVGRVGNAKPVSQKVENNTLAREAELKELLGETARLNGSGHQEEARRILDQLLGRLSDFVGVYDGSEIETSRYIHLAFKQGTMDLRPRANPYGLDYLPEWEPAAVAA